MPMKNPISTSLTFTALVLLTNVVMAVERPNVVYITADELGDYEPGFMGGRNIRTPNLDRPAAEGMRLSNMFAGSLVCAPTRCRLMTGKHAEHASVRTSANPWIPGPFAQDGTSRPHSVSATHDIASPKK